MSEQVKAQQACGEYSRAISSYPLRKWWQLGLWRTNLERLQGSWEASSEYLPLFVPHISGSKVNPGQMEEQYRWRVNLDVAHFFPSEISLRIRGSFLEVTGKHEERPDDHGFAARCFTRKYRLPAKADIAKMVSTLSADGILTVEAPVPESSVPAFTIIPIKVQMEEEKEKGRDELPDDGRGPEHPDFPAAEDQREMLQLEGQSYHGQSGGAANGLEQDKETFGEPAGEFQPPVPADGKSLESFQEEGRGTVASEQPEPAVVQGITQPEQGNQELEDQEQEQKDQELEEQELEDQGLEDQELEDQEQKDQELEDQKQEDQKQEDQELEEQELEDQGLEDQEQKDQELENQKQGNQELEDQELEDQKQGDRELKDQELENQEQEDQELENRKPEDKNQDMKKESTE